jgi:peptide/nickel transport system ATP-binding protein
MLELKARFGAAVVLITHDLGVVAETCQRVIVMYAGRKVEEAAVEELFAHPLHPYTRGLMRSIPRLALMRQETAPAGRLQEIPGTVPALSALPAGCAFAPRCPAAFDACTTRVPQLVPVPAPGGGTAQAACLLHEPGAPNGLTGEQSQSTDELATGEAR